MPPGRFYEDQYSDDCPAFGEDLIESECFDVSEQACLTSEISVEPSPAFEVGTLFISLLDAKEAAVKFSKCPVVQRSVRQLSYVYFECFRSGKAKTVIGSTSQRKLHSKNVLAHSKPH